MSLDAEVSKWLTDNLTAEDRKGCAEIFPANGITSLVDIGKLKRPDLTELKFSVGTQRFQTAFTESALINQCRRRGDCRCPQSPVEGLRQTGGPPPPRAGPQKNLPPPRGFAGAPQARFTPAPKTAPPPPEKLMWVRTPLHDSNESETPVFVNSVATLRGSAAKILSDRMHSVVAPPDVRIMVFDFKAGASRATVFLHSFLLSVDLLSRAVCCLLPADPVTAVDA